MINPDFGINGKTQIYGIFGFPIGHSLSPSMHNAAFKHLGVNAAYIPLSIPPDKLKEALKAIRILGIRGLNITVPHKKNIMKFLDSLSEEAALIGAVNTVVVDNDKLIGHNTDGRGFIKSLDEIGFNPRNKSFLILGSGGAAQAICIGIAALKPKEIFICDVIKERANSLRAHVRRIFTRCYIEAVPVDNVRVVKDRLDILVNATPIGLKETDPLPVDGELLREGVLVYDLIYNPMMTRLLALAKKRGLRFSNGLAMLLFQGALSFKLWTKRQPPLTVMRKALCGEILKCKAS